MSLCVCVCHLVEAMFAAMCECQALHPDLEDDDSDDNDFEGEEYNVEEAGEDKDTHTLSCHQYVSNGST